MPFAQLNDERTIYARYITEITDKLGEYNWTPPPTSGWSTTTLGSATFTSEFDGYTLFLPAASGDNWRVQYRDLAVATPYTVTAYFDWDMIDTNFQFTGLVLRDGTGKLVTFGGCYDTGFKFQAQKWTSATVFSADYRRIAITQFGQMPNWLRIRDNGTNRLCEFSFDGIRWVLFHTIGRTDFLTATQVGFGGNFNQASAATIYIVMRSFAET